MTSHEVSNGSGSAFAQTPSSWYFSDAHVTNDDTDDGGSGSYSGCAPPSANDSDVVGCFDDGPTPSMPPLTFVMCCLYALICAAGIFGNGLVVFVIVRFAKMRSVTNQYICNLAIADFCFLVCVPLLIVTVVQRAWIFGAVVCKAFHVLNALNWFASVYTLTAMSADRYLAVCHPISSMVWRTMFISRCVCAGVWAASAVVLLPVFLYAQTFERNGIESCAIIGPEWEWIDGYTAFIWYAFLFGFAVPVGLISIFYTLVVVRLRSVGPTKNRSTEKKRTRRRVTKMILTVIAVYVVAWLPYWIFQIVVATATGLEMGGWGIAVLEVITVLSYANSALNPLLYAFFGETFRKTFDKVLHCASNDEVDRCLPTAGEVSAVTATGGGGEGVGVGTVRRCGGGGAGASASVQRLSATLSSQI